MSLFAAVRLYVLIADRMERDITNLDSGSLRPLRDGAWAVWARLGDRTRELDPRPTMWRVKPGPVHLADNRLAPR